MASVNPQSGGSTVTVVATESPQPTSKTTVRLPSAGLVARWLALTLLLWLLGAAYLTYDAQRHARNAEDSLRRVADVAGGDLADVDFGAVEGDLAYGSDELRQARSSISSPVVRALGPVPVL